MANCIKSGPPRTRRRPQKWLATQRALVTAWLPIIRPGSPRSFKKWLYNRLKRRIITERGSRRWNTRGRWLGRQWWVLKPWSRTERESKQPRPITVLSILHRRSQSGALGRCDQERRKRRLGHPCASTHISRLKDSCRHSKTRLKSSSQESKWISIILRRKSASTTGQASLAFQAQA